MDHQPKKILAILGSTRKNSVNKIILDTLKKLYQDKLYIEIYDQIAALPHFNPDLEDEAIPLKVKEFYQLIGQANGVIICSPEYVFSLPGALKNAIEWTVVTTLFSDKPLAIIVASSLGEKAFESLELIMTTIGAKIEQDAKLLISGSNSKVNKENNTLKEAVLSDLKKLMESLIVSLKTV